MKRLSVLTVALLLALNCAIRNGSQMNRDSVSRAIQPASVTPTPTTDRGPNDSELPLKIDAPASFREIDFNNLSYPINWKRRIVPLTNGRAEYFQDKYLGNAWFELENVKFSDLTGDGDPEAIVDMSWVSCGGSCDGGSHLFYFYTIKNGKVKLLSRFETGSVAYDCALKSFQLKGRALALELFRTCRFKGNSFVEATAMPWENRGGKYIAQSITRFDLVFVRSKFVMQRSEVFKNPQEEIGNWEATVVVAND
jgi:hypothetical protein